MTCCCSSSKKVPSLVIKFLRLWHCKMTFKISFGRQIFASVSLVHWNSRKTKHSLYFLNKTHFSRLKSRNKKEMFRRNIRRTIKLLLGQMRQKIKKSRCTLFLRLTLKNFASYFRQPSAFFTLFTNHHAFTPFKRN